jgi:hypothetical protein
MYGHERAVTSSTTPARTTIGSTVRVAIGIIAAMIRCTLMVDLRRRLVSRYAAHMNIDDATMRLPVHVAAAFDGTLNSTIAMPTIDTSPYSSALGMIFSL